MGVVRNESALKWGWWEMEELRNGSAWKWESSQVKVLRNWRT